jgi:hypothetical protein
MSYKLKTLIVFDTNSLRSIEEGEIAYSFFTFGKPFQVIEEYLETSFLKEEVRLAVPDWAITEIKDQKERQYISDVQEYKKLAKRLSGLPHTGKISFPEVEFDCVTYIEQKAAEFFAAKQVVRLELQDHIGNNVLKSMMARVMRGDKKSPFANSGKYKDAGFKDNILWESLMNFEGIIDYDKIIFLTKDGDFNKNCIDEFKSKWKKYVAIEKDENNVIATLQKDYKNYIDYRKVYDFSEKEYFDNYLRDILNLASTVQVDGKDLKIENYQIKEHCSNVEMLEDEEGDFVCPVINSSVAIFTSNHHGKMDIMVNAKTKLSDFEYMDIQETVFEPNIY